MFIAKINKATAKTMKYLVETSKILDVLFTYIHINIVSKLISTVTQIGTQENEEITKIILK